MESSATTGYRFGERLASHPVPEDLRRVCQARADAFYAQQVATEFSEQVDTLAIPRGFAGLRRTWVPAAPVLRAAGYRVAAGRGHWVVTTGVDPHDDAAFGPTLLWTLRNDGLQFWPRGGVRRVPPAGDILIFDDTLPHSMDLTAAQQKDARFETAVWIGWALPLERLRAA